MDEKEIDTHHKALQVNLDPKKYGTIVEIGAGQEVARWFFRVGAAAGTVAKTMSAYDMQVSDAIYGKSGRYVSGERLNAMIDHEWKLLIERLDPDRGADTTFFCFADTVSARNYHGTNICHGWLGMRFLLEPQGEPHTIRLHVNMSDSTNLLQQQAVGVLGVNMIYGAFEHHNDIDKFVSSLLDNLSTERIDVDFLELKGRAFEKISDEHTLLSLIRNKITPAIAFSGEGEPSFPMAEIYKSPVLMERGTFREVQPFHNELLDNARKQYEKEGIETKREPKQIFEMTTQAADQEEELQSEELLKRVKSLSQFKKPILITSYTEGYHLSRFLRRYTDDPIRFTMGLTQLIRLMDERYYEHLKGAFVEGMGRLISSGIKIYVAPMEAASVKQHLKSFAIHQEDWKVPNEGKASLANTHPLTPSRHLYSYLFETGSLVPMK